jgi:hypothetical protein
MTNKRHKQRHDDGDGHAAADNDDGVVVDDDVDDNGDGGYGCDDDDDNDDDDDDDDDGECENKIQQVIFLKSLKHVLQHEAATTNHLPCPRQKLIGMAHLGYPVNMSLLGRHSIH